jgi:hypothetical protein
MIKLEDRMSWPRVGSVWEHTNGNRYQVIMFTNIETDKQETYPTTIIYRNTLNSKHYSRKLMDWDRSMLFINEGIEE